MKKLSPEGVAATVIAFVLAVPLTVLITIPWAVKRWKASRPNAKECSTCKKVVVLDKRGFCPTCKKDPNTV